ncbi:hypothetical protein QWY87_11105 [Lutimonas halocynthiae]|uniref:hypothetical protein n=1 Tax=Lutimonas halocynthiae TaxID=1446477 RepID=UPI0025B55AB1|nr:hypothetical protein [Lutimonas halocynthiae]MDN3643252.1 hypothetical protein [Lutimonas halocynthiae]
MKIIVKLIGVLIILVGVSLLAYPEIIIGWIENDMESTSLYIFAIAGRLVFGILFIAAARDSKHPGVMKVFGYLFIIAAVIFVFIGKESFHGFMASIVPDAKPFAPLSGLLSIGFGAFLVYAFSGNKELEKK